MAQLITNRYATALFTLAQEQDKLEQFEQEATVILEVLTKEVEFIQVLEQPGILQGEKIKLVEDVFGGKASDEFVGLFVLLVKKSRQSFIIEILEAFIDMAKETKGFMKASVTSAIALDEKQLAQIKANIEKSTSKQIELTALVDPNIIGGMIIRVGDKVVDGSVRGKLQALKTDLSNLRLA
ncbi:MAG: ATP synthase F1 subunit delta [Epulopiscium sp. Nele67-Bin005]|nr:MAG: ATP synthase F1 subunit delta [Epulopiscium sp. Nele67-Bin005]